MTEQEDRRARRYAESEARWAAVTARADRLTAAQEGVVKALDNLTRLNFNSAVDIDWDIGEAGFSECYFDLHDVACVALKELEEASK